MIYLLIISASVANAQELRRIDVDRTFWHAQADTHFGIYPLYHQDQVFKLAVRNNSVKRVEWINVSSSPWIPSDRIGWVFHLHPNATEIVPSHGQNPIDELVVIPDSSFQRLIFTSLEDLQRGRDGKKIFIQSHSPNLTKNQEAELLKIVITYALYYSRHRKSFVYSHFVLLTSEILTHGRPLEFSVNPLRQMSMIHPAGIILLLQMRAFIRGMFQKSCFDLF